MNDESSIRHLQQYVKPKASIFKLTNNSDVIISICTPQNDQKEGMGAFIEKRAAKFSDS
jgi:hypothetical protein